MPEKVISNTSCLIVLQKIDELDLLHKVYGKIVTTPQVIAELGIDTPDWIEIKSVSDPREQQILELIVDEGEASAIALAMEYQESLLILDDYKARKIAEKSGLRITGTIGVIIKAKKRGIIDSVRFYLDKISDTDFRITKELINKALKEAGE